MRGELSSADGSFNITRLFKLGVERRAPCIFGKTENTDSHCLKTDLAVDKCNVD